MATVYFFYEVQDFVVKQRIRNCLWKRASRSLFENCISIASFKYALKKRFFLSTQIVWTVFFVAKYNPEPKRKNNNINDVVSIILGLRCDEERKEKLLTCAMEIQVGGRSLSVVFYLNARKVNDLITIFPYRSPLPNILDIFKGGSVQNPDPSGACGGLFKKINFTSHITVQLT